jgi:hypothetical protein
MKPVHMTFIALLLSCSLCVFCSEAPKTEQEKGAIDQITDQAADTAVKAIKTPIDKAKNVEVEQKARLEAQQKEVESVEK